MEPDHQANNPFQRETEHGIEYVIPDIAIVGYGRTRINQGRCLKCKRLSFDQSPICGDCGNRMLDEYGPEETIEKIFKLAPTKNITTDHTVLCRYIGFKQKTGISKNRSTKNFKWVMRRDEFTCRYCGMNMREELDQITVDHVNPFCTGGNNDVENLACCCRTCNSIGNDLVFNDFWAKREYIRKRRKQKGYTIWD